MKMIEPKAGEIAEAKKIPNGWVYRIAGKFSDSERVPPEAIVGAWQVDKNGNIVGEFQKNQNYDALKWPSKSDF